MLLLMLFADMVERYFRHAVMPFISLRRHYAILIFSFSMPPLFAFSILLLLILLMIRAIAAYTLRYADAAFLADAFITLYYAAAIDYFRYFHAAMIFCRRHYVSLAAMLLSMLLLLTLLIHIPLLREDYATPLRPRHRYALLPLFFAMLPLRHYALLMPLLPCYFRYATLHILLPHFRFAAAIITLLRRYAMPIRMFASLDAAAAYYFRH